MITATKADRSTVVDILISAFESNQSVNYIIPQDERKLKRLRILMEYSFESCLRYGKIILSADRKGCALILFPDRRKTTLRSIYWDLKLALKSIGLRNLLKAIQRESKIKTRHPDQPFVYLWFIGVQQGSQRQGIGSALLRQLIQYAQREPRQIYLETSTLVNIPWYQEFGFEQYDELDFGYKLFFFKRV